MKNKLYPSKYSVSMPIWNNWSVTKYNWFM